ncbi:MAG TPA: glutaredoxin 3 [Candidatus Bathyarchaeia archaeon]|jgi:glutaredoxin 3|nr:glutaredoxin 3 [Candidatus Bathyarchaeia archaeon]
MADVTIYTTNYCPFCTRAKALLKQKGVAFQEIDLTDDDAERARLVERTGGRRTVPQIFIDGESIGGYEELAALDRAGRLDPMLARG